jgi:hypothetical protein
MERRIADIGRRTAPRDDQPPLIEDEPELAPNDPSTVADAFSTDLSAASAFSPGDGSTRCRSCQPFPARSDRREIGPSGPNESLNMAIRKTCFSLAYRPGRNLDLLCRKDTWFRRGSEFHITLKI